MIRRPPRSTPLYSSAASDVYKRQRLNNTNAATLVAGLPYDYHGDLLELLSKYKVYERCAADTLLPILENGGISVGEMLTSHSLVRSYDQAMRDRMLSDAHNAVPVSYTHLRAHETGRN